MSDEARYCITGRVACAPLWGADRQGRQTLETRIIVSRSGGSGQQYEDVLQVRVRGNDLQAEARKIQQGSRVAVYGRIAGRIWHGERGERIYMDLIAEAIVPLEPPRQAQWSIAPPSAPPQGVAEEDVRYPAPAPAPADYSDTPF